MLSHTTLAIMDGANRSVGGALKFITCHRAEEAVVFCAAQSAGERCTALRTHLADDSEELAAEPACEPSRFVRLSGQRNSRRIVIVGESRPVPGTML